MTASSDHPFRRLDRLPAIALFCTLLLAAPVARAQDAGGGTGGGARSDDKPEAGAETPPPEKAQLGDRVGTQSREGMWPAPTAEDWKKPVLIPFQRTWDDALAVAKEENKAILICVNMDGEIASEHYAGKRYRQPEVAELYSGYVSVIASVYRHTPRDYDEEGNRILCPRFGSVTCSEHIAIEPILYEKYFNGDRVAPRHLMIELDGSEVYDKYYINDTASVFDSIREGIAKRTEKPKNVVRGDRPVTERVASRHLDDRKAVEKAYKSGDAALRKSLLDQALKNPEASPMELLRLAVFGLDVDRSRQAREALAKADDKAATDVIVEALRVPMDTPERDALIAALERIGKTSRRAAWLAVVQKGLTGSGSKLDTKGWSRALAKAPAGAPAIYEANALHGTRDRSARAAKERPKDPLARLALAESTLELARKGVSVHTSNPKTAKAFKKLMYHDARQAALDAEKLGAEALGRDAWRVHAVIALASYDLNEKGAAYDRAEKAMELMPPGEPGWNAMATLTLYGESRYQAIKAAVKAKQKWEPQWLSDLHAAYTVLLQHPLAHDGQVLWYYDFLVWLRAYSRAGRYLDAGIARFPNATELHNRYRTRVLRWKGVKGLEAAYARLETAHPKARDLPWFSAFASQTAADFHRRRGRPKSAIPALERAISKYTDAMQRRPGSQVATAKQIALAQGGLARLHYQLDDDVAALTAILASFEASPDTAGTRDGVGVTPGETAQMLLARLKKSEHIAPVERLEAAMEKLDPELLKFDRP